MTILIDETTNAIYIGDANRGAETSSEVWQIKKVSLSSGKVTSITYAQGLNAWDDRTTLEYA